MVQILLLLVQMWVFWGQMLTRMGQIGVVLGQTIWKLVLGPADTFDPLGEEWMPSRNIAEEFPDMYLK